MGRNVEIKAKVANLATLLDRLDSLADDGPSVIHQEDTFFPCPTGRLKFRRFSKKEGELIFYQRLDAAQPKESHYLRSPSHDPDGLVQLLSQVLGVRGVVRKRRTLYRLGQTRVHLDEVEGLGTFLELEVVLEPSQTLEEGAGIARKIMTGLGIQEDDLVKAAYIDLLK
jgi:adenylate cyclase